MGEAYAGTGGNEEKGTLHYISGSVVGGFAYEGEASVDSGAIKTTISFTNGGNSASLAASAFTGTGFDIDSTISGSANTNSIKWIAIEA